MDLLINGSSLAFEDGDLAIADGITEIKQHIMTALKTLYGEWILDNSKGLDYAAGFRDIELLENNVKNQILGVVGVEALENFDIRFNKQEMSVCVNSGIKTVYGNFSVEETIRI